MNKKINFVQEENKFQHSNYWIWILLAIILLITIAIRIRLLSIPLERDEGEYAYTGQLLLQGIPPYVQAYNMKMPGIYAIYALILGIFGQTNSGIHFGLLITNLATIILMFFLAKKLYDSLTGIITSASFAFLSLGQWILGMQAHAEHFVILFAVGGILVLLHAIDFDRFNLLFLSGLLFGIAFTMKQHGIGFILFGIVYLIVNQLDKKPSVYSRTISKFLLFSSGIALPFLFICFLFFALGIFDKFWFWTFKYASTYVSSVSLAYGFKILMYLSRIILSPSILLWTIAGIGVVAFIWDKEKRSTHLFVTGFFIFSFLSMCPGFYFRDHYFILALPAVSLLIGTTIISIRKFIPNIQSLDLKKTLPILIFLVALVHSMNKQYEFLFKMSPTVASRITYGYNPFPESMEVARYIKKNTSDKDTILVLGSEPQIYFYTHRCSATGYIYMYPLMEGHKYALEMQKEMITEVEQAQPKFLVYIHIPQSWLVSQNSEKLIFDWFESYSAKYFERVGVVDMLLPMTKYMWGHESMRYLPQSNCWFYVYRRK